MLDERAERLHALGDQATLDDIAAALAKPAITAVSDAGCAERGFLRIVARVAARPSSDMEDWMQAALSRSNTDLLPHLRRVLPGVPDDELRFRTECAVGILHFLVTGNMRIDLEHKSAAELERLFVPVISGVLAAGAPAAR
jgi:hypothetical protein